ncbi:MAG: recombinase family protein [Azospirillum sp.]|nr:recombinase family protein [Azospirillum sp.]
MTRRIGYARVSTEDQSTRSQVDELAAAGCDTVFIEHASGGDRRRPELAKAIAGLRAGDTLIVVRIDRLARSLAHLLEVIEEISGKKAFFRSLRDPIDTASPQGMFTLQVLGAAAQLERALIRERTLSGLAAARRQGRIGGNPGVRAGDPAALAKIASARLQTRLKALRATDREWLPYVRAMRPGSSWKIVAETISQAKGDGGKWRSRPKWSIKRLKSAARLYVREGFLDPEVFGRAPARKRRGTSRAYDVAIGAKLANPRATLSDIATMLTDSKIPTPTGARRWTVPSVQNLIERARDEGKLPPGRRRNGRFSGREE